MTRMPSQLVDQAAGRIEDLRTWTVRLPLRTALVHATADASALESVVVEVRLDTGVVGRAEVRANGAYATGEDAGDILEALRTVNLGEGSVSPAATVRSLLARSKLAAMAVDVAVWDAAARHRGIPLHRLWAPDVSDRSAVRTHAQIGFHDDATTAASWVAAGFDRLKVRVGSPDPDADVARLHAIVDAVGAGVELVVDANGGWSVEQALRVEAQLRELPIGWLEQPVATVEELAQLRGRTRVPVYADEVSRDAASVERLIGVVDGVHLKLEKCGTVARLFQAVEVARRAGLRVALGQMDQGRLGCAITTQLAVALGFERAELWGCAAVLQDLTDELRLQDGCVVVPTGPGSGVTHIDHTMLKEVA